VLGIDETRRGRPKWIRHRPVSDCRTAITRALPHAVVVVVDDFHLVRLA
jgi:hypothetical protein